MSIALRGARRAVFGFFGINGATLAVWISYIPTVKHDLALSDSTLGWVLLMIAAGALTAMQLAGRLIDRVGPARVTVAAGVALPVSLVAPAMAGSLFALLCACFVLGAANGMMDVAMNAQAVEVERGHGRPIMSAFHAMFSLGGMAGAGVGALFLAVGWPISAALPTAGLGLACLVVVSARTLLAARPILAATTGLHAADPPAARTRRRVPLVASLLGLLAFSGMVVEGAAADWSGVHLRDVIGVGGGLVALGYVGFSSAMFAGRLLGDRLVLRAGPLLVVRWGGVLATAGVLLVVTGPGPVVVITGWVLAGAGISCVVPQIFTAAGNLGPDASGAPLARTATLGYLGFLAGPPLIGMVAEAADLSVALLIPALLALVVAGSARIVRRSPASVSQG